MNLSDVYSFIDSKKRKLSGLLSDPGATIDQYIGQIKEDNDKRLNLQSNAYPMKGDKSVLNSPHQLDQFRRELADEGANMAMAGMFVGPGSKTWDKVAADKALGLEKAGTDPRKIWSETGNWKGPDGAWRQEIDDKSAFKPGYGLPDGNEYGSFSDILFHPRLKKAYPEINQTFARAAVGDVSKGSFSNAVPATKTDSGLMAEIFAQGPNRKDIKETLLHEVQHGIQDAEGWARGGTPSEFDSKAAEKARDILNWRKELEIFMGKKGIDPKTNADAWMNADNLLANEYHSLEASDWIPDEGTRQAAKQGWFASGTPGRSNLEKTVSEYGLDKRTTPRSQMEMYRSLAGEAEARATQARIPLDAAQRRALFPEDSYDVPVNELIVRGLLK